MRHADLHLVSSQFNPTDRLGAPYSLKGKLLEVNCSIKLPIFTQILYILPFLLADHCGYKSHGTVQQEGTRDQRWLNKKQTFLISTFEVVLVFIAQT